MKNVSRSTKSLPADFGNPDPSAMMTPAPSQSTLTLTTFLWVKSVTIWLTIGTALQLQSRLMFQFPQFPLLPQMLFPTPLVAMHLRVIFLPHQLNRYTLIRTSHAWSNRKRIQMKNLDYIWLKSADDMTLFKMEEIYPMTTMFGNAMDPPDAAGWKGELLPANTVTLSLISLPVAPPTLLLRALDPKPLEKIQTMIHMRINLLVKCKSCTLTIHLIVISL